MARASGILPTVPETEARVDSSRAARLNSRFITWAFISLCASLQMACAPGPDAREEASVEGVAPVVYDAQRAMERGDFDAAIAGYRKAFERTPWNTRLESSLVAAYAGRAAAAGRSREGLRTAEADLRTALGIAPADPALTQSLATVLLERAARAEDPESAAALREEARHYAPDLEARTPKVQLAVERRLDMAFDLVERGQLDAGIDRLERLHAEYPDRPDAARLLAQARVRKGTELVTLQDYRGAGDSFDRAVDLYELLAPCDGSRCDTTELRLAHRNRVVAWLSAYEAAQARQALADAERAGLRLPALRAELDRLGVSPR